MRTASRARSTGLLLTLWLAHFPALVAHGFAVSQISHHLIQMARHHCAEIKLHRGVQSLDAAFLVALRRRGLGESLAHHDLQCIVAGLNLADR